MDKSKSEFNQDEYSDKFIRDQQASSSPTESKARGDRYPLISALIALVMGVLGNLISAWVQQDVLDDTFSPSRVIAILVFTLIGLFVGLWLQYGPVADQRQKAAPAFVQLAYTNSPELHPNLVLGSFQLLVWLLLHPAAWRNYIIRIDSSLHPDFTLVELNRQQWRHPALWRILIMAYVVWPIVVVVLTGVVHFSLSNDPMYDLVTNTIYGSGAVITFGIIGGLLYGVAGGVAYGIIFGLQYIIWSIVTTSANMELALVLGWVSIGMAFGLSGSVVAHLAPQTRKLPVSEHVLQTVSSFIVSILACLAMLGVPLVALILILILAFSITEITPGITVLGYFVVVCTTVVALTYWITGRWWKSIVVGFAIGVLTTIASYIQLGLLTVDISQAILASAILITWGTFYSTLFALCYHFTRSISALLPRVVAASIVAGVFFAAFFFANTNVTSLPTTLVGIVIGLTFIWWLPVILYPFEMAWNLLLYWIDLRRLPDRPSTLKWHSAFWNNHQRLPLFILDRHLVLVMEHDSLQGEAAIQYLDGASHQQWAVTAARIEIEARQLERCADAEAISHIYLSLEEDASLHPARSLIREFRHLSLKTEVALNLTDEKARREELEGINSHLNRLLRELDHRGTRYDKRFLPIVGHWRTLIANELPTRAQTGSNEHQEHQEDYSNRVHR